VELRQRLKIRPLWIAIGLVIASITCASLILGEAYRQRALVENMRERGTEITFYPGESKFPSWCELDLTLRVRSIGAPGLVVSDADLSALRDFPNLEELTVSCKEPNRIRDISHLASLKNLKRLGLFHATLADISVLGELHNLESLGLGDCDVLNLDPARNLTHLEILILSELTLDDLSPLEDLPKLKSLSLFEASVNSLNLVQRIGALHRLQKRNGQIGFHGSLGSGIRAY
jgi:Leucine-rich repeat (LRR) protein